jgi:hypothetical protein
MGGTGRGVVAVAITTSSGGFSIVQGIVFLRLWFAVDLPFSRWGQFGSVLPVRQHRGP